MKKTICFLLIIFLAFLFFILIINHFAKKTPERIKIQEKIIINNKTMLNKDKETENEEITIITVYDNYQFDPSLRAAHGFSCLVKLPEKNFLFDTGADSQTLLFNMEKMNIDPEEIDLIFLSHIHGDHVGGLSGFLQQNKKVKIFIPASFPDSIKNQIRNNNSEYEDISEATKITDIAYSTGELGTWIIEQSLIIDTEKGLVIITGCAHPGIVKIVEEAKQIVADKDVYLVLGGFHLSGSSDAEIKSIIKSFKDLGVQKVAPCHCSGDKARMLFKQEYQNDFIENGVGQIIKL